MEKQHLPVEYKEFLTILNQLEARYLVVGSWALAFHGSARMTRDIDIWVAIDSANAKKVRKAWVDFGGPGLPGDDFFQEGKNVYWMGRESTRIEIVSGIDGVSFEECYQRRESIKWDSIEIAFLSYGDFVKNKRASGRFKDLADLEVLGEEID